MHELCNLAEHNQNGLFYQHMSQPVLSIKNCFKKLLRVCLR
ncbi:hypothetical protein HYG88_09785 [Acinetobacter sp. SwsAc4]|nr:hypothetical protein [Acinetobacter sp. SwsAc4]